MKRLLVIQVAAMGHELLRENGALQWQGLEFAGAQSVFPALTCVAQASFRTGMPPMRHGMIANGVFDRRLNRPMFWEQSARLVEGARIWENFRARGGRVGMMFWQQSLGEAVDMVLSPAPIHKHHGGMIQDCYSQPPGLYGRLCERLGGAFKLRQYWGPLASAKVGDWTARATAEVMADRQLAPELLLTYLPSLDYDLQRFGPHAAKSQAALQKTLAQLDVMVQAARREGYDVLIFGDYAIADVSAAVFPNRALLEAGLMTTRNVRGMLYPDFHTSRAFAMVDHEIAHVYVRAPADLDAAKQALQKLPGVAEVQLGAGETPARRAGETPAAHADRMSATHDGETPSPHAGKMPATHEGETPSPHAGKMPATHEGETPSPHAGKMPATHATHANAGELVILAKEGHWFAYPWWTDKREAPDFAGHVDIHNKPGYDPCELFFGWPPPSVSQDATRIRGSHGRVGPGREVAWASTLPLAPAGSLIDLAAAVGRWLDEAV
jgi:hypothetical protein